MFARLVPVEAVRKNLAQASPQLPRFLATLSVLFCGWRRITPILRLHVHAMPPCVSRSKFTPFYKDSPMGLGPTLTTSFSLSYLQQDLIYKYSQMLRWGGG